MFKNTYHNICQYILFLPRLKHLSELGDVGEDTHKQKKSEVQKERHGDDRFQHASGSSQHKTATTTEGFARFHWKKIKDSQETTLLG